MDYRIFRDYLVDLSMNILRTKSLMIISLSRTHILRSNGIKVDDVKVVKKNQSLLSSQNHFVM